MTQSKQKEILVRIPRGQEDRFSTYSKIAKELGVKSINSHIWDLIKTDEQKLFALIQTLSLEVK